MKKLAENPQFITSIYNYCDRWCERCPFTSRCMTFALSDEQFADPEARDIHNELFWQKMAETLTMTIDLLRERAEQEGVDLDSIDSEKEAEEEELTEEVVKNHACCREAKGYGEMVENWFNSVEYLFGKNEDEQNFQEQDETRNAFPLETSSPLEDMVQVIRWYQHQIYIKLMRAIRGKLEEKPETIDDYAKDSDGSAKVALIGIDRSIAAWGEMRNHLPFHGNDVLAILSHLNRLCGKVEKVFPDARAFIRPGFDKINLNS